MSTSHTTDTTHTKPTAEQDPAVISRRKFFSWLSIGLSGLFGALLGIPFVGFLLGPLFRTAPELWQPVRNEEGEVVDVDHFNVGETKLVTFQDPSPLPWAGVTARQAAWMRRQSEEEFVAFAVNCTHLGCPIRWLPDASIFMCPCHGGVFYEDGSVAAGPPPEPLTQYQVRVQQGQVQILAEPTGEIAG